MDDLEEAFRRGAAAALRQRAERQRTIAEDWTVRGARGVIVRSGEGAIALRIAEALDQVADEFEAKAKS